MATFLRVGDRVINLDLVTDVRLYENQVNIYVAVPDKAGDARVLVFKDGEAKKLTEWFDLHARDAATSPTAFSFSYLK